MLKRCANCGETKTRDQFTKRKGRVDGLHPYCRVCTRAQSKQQYREKRIIRLMEMRFYYMEKRDEILDRVKKYQAQPHVRAQRKAYQAEYYQNHK